MGNAQAQSEQDWRQIKASVEQVPEWAGNLAFGQTAKAAARAKLEAFRGGALATIMAAHAATAAALPGLERELDAAADRRDKRREALQAADAELAAVRDRIRAVESAPVTLERQHGELLRETAPACLADFARELQNKAEELRNAGASEEREGFTRRKGYLGSEKVAVTFSNQAGLNAVLEAIYSARAKAQQLPYSVATEADALAAIERLRATIPFERVHEMVQTPSEIEMEG
jgi:chromosome segregation ATPase